MSLLGIHFKMKIGEGFPEKAPQKFNEALQSVSVTHSDEGRSGFQLSFQIGRGRFDLQDYALVMKDSKLRPFNRVQLIVYIGLTEHVLMDGIITNRQFGPSNEPGASTLTITGEDVSLMLDLEQRSKNRIAQDDIQIVEEILKGYGTLGLKLHKSKDLSKRVNQPKDKDDRASSQPTNMTDLGYINYLAKRYGFVTYVESGENPLGTNIFYWGPPKRDGPKQGVLSANMGPYTNVSSISFSYDGLSPKKSKYQLDDKTEGIVSESSLKGNLEMAKRSAVLKRVEFLGNTKDMKRDEAHRLAQGEVDNSVREIVTASGELDALRYGGVLLPRRRVPVRGVGYSYDGMYYVKSVSHTIDIRQGTYNQSFTLTREGEGTLIKFLGL